MLLLFVIGPFIVTFRHGVLFLNVLGAAILVAGSYALSERKQLFRTAVVLSAISTIGACLPLAFPQHWAVLASHSSVILLAAFFCVSILAYVLHSGRVTSDKIFAAICVYLLLGFVWTYTYALLDDMQPGSFADSTETGRTDDVAHVSQLRYFSFATLTTLGYGDILPRSSTARTMAVLEAVMGQIYLAVLVARLVGLHIVHANRSQSRDED
ncbi:MAG TPA: potassium channel family protein [Chthoniobacterales bacterium]|nr:potassium channel family protein [Chthoniobacterales bacterium]